MTADGPAQTITALDFHKELSTIQQDIREIKTLLSERHEATRENAKNIGEAFDEIKSLREQNQQTLNEIRRLAERQTAQDAKTSGYEQRIVAQDAVISELRKKVHDMEWTIQKWTIYAGLGGAGLAMAGPKLMSLFAG
jgi:predicted  nucleic acid-binding Zn-ribbon protein